MSSDQYSHRPMPSDKHCPYCGAANASNADECWLCKDKLSIREGMPRPSERRQKSYPVPEEAWAGDNLAWMVLGGLAMFLCLSLAISFPGILILLLVLATPALIRAVIAHSRKEGTLTFATGPSFVVVFLSSLGITAIVGLASFVAFFATCFVVCLGVLSMDNRGSTGNLILVASVGAGLVPGGVVAFLLFRRLFPLK